jgi:dihydropteroate synthase
MAKDTFFHKKATLNARGRLIDLSTPKVMGIINLTPDSFYAGSRQPAVADALQQAQKMLTEGAAFLDPPMPMIFLYRKRPTAYCPWLKPW